MAKTKVTVEVTPSSKVDVASIHIDSTPIPLVNNRATVSLGPGRHLLVWHFAGPSGETLGITVDSSRGNLLTIKKSTIPAGEAIGAGIERFKV